ncbi:hypothetical protein KKF82_06445 [Patescibacteria group bacterium]|nr:hypothetical protein [Patescibacteria group bacterium]
MPTYTNSFAGLVQLKDITFSGNEVKPIYNYIDLTQDSTGYISLSSHAPYVNPSNWVHTVTSADATITLVSWKNTEGIEVYNTSGNLITVFLNSTDNLPGIVVPANSVRYIYGFKGGVQTLALTYSGAVNSGECYITELKNRLDLNLEMVS